MSVRRVQFRRGTTAENSAFTGAVGELTVNTTTKAVRVHDGSTLGGTELARADLDNINFTVEVLYNISSLEGVGIIPESKPNLIATGIFIGFIPNFE